MVCRQQHRRTSNAFTVTLTTYTTEDENEILHTNDDLLASTKGLVSLSCAPSCYDLKVRVQIEQLEANAGQYSRAPPPPSPPQHQIYNAEPSPPPRRRQPDNDNAMIAGKAPPPSEFN